VCSHEILFVMSVEENPVVSITTSFITKHGFNTPPLAALEIDKNL